MAGYPLCTMSVECCISKKETRQPSHQSVRNPLIRVSEATRTPPEAERRPDGERFYSGILELVHQGVCLLGGAVIMHC